MNQEDILTLARAGFSRAEILAMIQPDPAAPQPEPQPAADPAPAAPQQPSNQDVLAAINSLTAAIQNINRNSAQQPGQTRLTGDDVMAGFIRPPKPENK